MQAYKVVSQFEEALSDYTGAPYAVTTNSCTMALLLACAYTLHGPSNNGVVWPPAIEIPKRTYVSVPMSILHVGGRVIFRDENWSGCYQLKPYPVWDCARRFTSGMAVSPNKFYCVSFHSSKILGDTQGGCILHHSTKADAWFRRARFDGRWEGIAPKDDHFSMLGWHCYMSPDVAARLLLKLSVLPKNNPDLPNDDYPDLSKMEIFK